MSKPLEMLRRERDAAQEALDAKEREIKATEQLSPIQRLAWALKRSRYGMVDDAFYYEPMKDGVPTFLGVEQQRYIRAASNMINGAALTSGQTIGLAEVLEGGLFN